MHFHVTNTLPNGASTLHPPLPHPRRPHRPMARVTHQEAPNTHTTSPLPPGHPTSTLAAQNLGETTVLSPMACPRQRHVPRDMGHPYSTQDSEVVSLESEVKHKTERVTTTRPTEQGRGGTDPRCPAHSRNPSVLRCPIIPWCPKGVRACRDIPRASLGVKLPLIAVLLAGVATGSEFPDRECCDSVPPPPPNYHQATSTTTTTTPTPLPGQNNTSVHTVSHGVSGVMNCIEARHQCKNDGQCRDVLDMLHKICGPELVACATVTPGKCKTLLRTLGQYDYLRSCTCREAHIDFNCYTFREMIFNHPCSLVETPDEHQTYMKTCTEADVDCKNNISCMKNYMKFMNYCGYSGITCTSQQSEKCNESWKRIRTTSRFGCYCPVQARAVSYGGHSAYDPNSQAKKEDKCMDFYNDTHANPCLAGQRYVARATMVETSQAMCHVALEHCTSDPECNRELNNINTWCDHSHCEPDRCRNALQEFYQRVKVVRRLQVAFCVCRQSDHDGECLMAMRRLHPTCAERHTPRDPMQCHKIAEQCRKNRVCSAKLQQYEQNCAADAMTGLCSDSHRSCQQAVMNILGTELHATCVCKGTDFLHQQDCYTWQKLLWSNPCVIESHLKLHEEINGGAAEELDEEFRSLTPAPPTSTPAPIYGPTHDFGNIVYRPKAPSLGPQTHDNVEPDSSWSTGRRTGIQIGQTNRGFESRGGILGKYDPVYNGGERSKYPDNKESHFGRGRVSGVYLPTKIIPHTPWLGRAGGEHGGGGFGGGYRGTGIPIPSQETRHENPIIGEDWGDLVGRGRGRAGVYSPPDFDKDREPHPRPTRYPINRGYPRTPVNFLPITPTPPSLHTPTRAAVTPTTSTTTTPTTSPTSEYTLGPGIYLFLGYSRGEVEILKPHTSMNEHEAVKVLESVLVRDYGFQCELTTKHHIGENFIVVAKLQVNPDTYISPFVKQRREKEVCAGPLEKIAEKINSRPRHEDIRTDAILSMFVLAKVDVHLPEPHTSPSHASTLSHATPLLLLVLVGAQMITRRLLLTQEATT